MDTTSIVFVVLQVLASLFLIAVVLLQSGKRSGLSGAIAGVADTFMAKNKARSFDARLTKMTKWVAIGFIVVTLALNILSKSM
ncbi:MAG: preprotein translocase subunit SecG [Oscillospiraceae bacterium]|jgi:preprotein translocase subunit SecG|nr:preprotein translocase subunit SecG [Oscillospiraceae bacterium]